MKMLIDMLKDIEEHAGTAPLPKTSPLTPADEEVVENLLARFAPRGIGEGPPRRHGGHGIIIKI